jgi:hypothetical protein
LPALSHLALPPGVIGFGELRQSLSSVRWNPALSASAASARELCNFKPIHEIVIDPGLAAALF